MIDNLSTHQTPEGIELSLMPAGIVPRIGAWLIDFAIRVGILYGLVTILQIFDDFGMGLILISYFLLDWFYPVFFEVFNNGQTIGKKQFGLRVCQEDATPICWQASMTRNLLRVADFLPFAFFSGIVSMLFHHQSKRLGDIVAGTLVVYVNEVETGYEISSIEPEPLPMSLQLDEQQAILAFAERAEALPIERKLELAGILTDVAGVPSQQMPEKILGYANTILGKQISVNNNQQPSDIGYLW